MKRSLALIAPIFLSACAPAPAVGPEIPSTLPAPQTFSSFSQQVLVPSCATAACHTGDPPLVYPQLDADVAWDKLVGVPSEQASGMNLVEPYDPANSYLVVKLRTGGLQGVMPVGLAAIDEAEIEAIEAWIAEGAPND